MTDKDIIKALECCSKAHGVRDCISLNCPLFDKERHLYLCIHGDTDLFGISLDLINRQKAEIEKWKQRFINSECDATNLTGEVISLSTERDSLKSELDAAIKAITPCCLNCKHYNRNQLGDYGCLKKYEPSGTSRCANWKWIGVKESEVENNAE